MDKVYVIAPDHYSGEHFNEILVSKGIPTDFHVHKISPRVIDNKISASEDVSKDLNLVFKSIMGKVKNVVIACNTLQLWVDQIDNEYKNSINIFTTFDACKWRFARLKQKPVWLGTSPLVEVTKDFLTLLSYKDFETQEMVQELIWRVKMYGGDNIETATDRVKKDFSSSKRYQWIKMQKIKLEIIESINRHNIKDVILGCTELPIIFDKPNEAGINFYNPANILAEYLVHKLN